MSYCFSSSKMTLSKAFLWPTVCEWHRRFCGRQITSFPMTNRTRKWVTLYILWKAVSSHLFPWPTGSKWHCPFKRQSHQIFSYDQQLVSDISHILWKATLSHLILTNSEWATLHILWKSVSSCLFPSPTGSEWHTLWRAVSLYLFPWSTGSEYC